MAIATSAPPADAITPLPLGKISVISAINLINTASYLMTFPFVPFLILSFYPDLSSTEIGYYSGVLEGSFHIGAFFSAYIWGALSDKYGRRPALLWGLMGTIFSCIAFGCSTSYTMALLSRAAWGLLNGNVGVAKTCLSELTDDTNTSKAFSYIGVATGFGRLIGPALGGLLAEPVAKYPHIFGDIWLFAKFPYLLPCLVGAILTFCTLVIAYFVLEETIDIARREQAEIDRHNQADSERMEHGAEIELPATVKEADNDAETTVMLKPGAEPTGKSKESLQDEDRCIDEGAAAHGGDVEMGASIAEQVQQHATPHEEVTEAEDAPLRREGGFSPARPSHRYRKCCGDTLRMLSDRAVLVSNLLYTALGFVGLISSEVFPLYVLNDKAHGGFGWKSSEIGIVATIAGPCLIVFQAFIYARLVRYFGLLRFTRLTFCLFTVMLVTTPMCSLTAEWSPQLQWVVIATHFCLMTLCRVATFTSVFVFVANSALPMDRGRVNGLGQSMVSIVRAVGPPLATSLFAWSVSDANTELGWPVNYYLSWYVMGLFALGALYLTFKLPRWIERKRKA